jgi:hypothetical protein
MPISEINSRSRACCRCCKKPGAKTFSGKEEKSNRITHLPCLSQSFYRLAPVGLKNWRMPSASLVERCAAPSGSVFLMLSIKGPVRAGLSATIRRIASTWVGSIPIMGAALSPLLGPPVPPTPFTEPNSRCRVDWRRKNGETAPQEAIKAKPRTWTTGPEVVA